MNIKLIPTKELLESSLDKRTKWAEYMRSGDYEQMQETMTVPGKEDSCGCCLHIYQLSRGIPGIKSLHSINNHRHVGIDQYISIDMPDKHQGQEEYIDEFYFNDSPACYFKFKQGWLSADFSSMNDSMNLSFDQIAEIVIGNSIEIDVSLKSYELRYFPEYWPNK